MRIEPEHGCTPATKSQRRAVSETADDAFAATLASAVEASSTSEPDGPAPELSAATYRLFAAIDLNRGDTKHADLHLARVEDAREAGIPLHPSGVLSEIGRWDYNADAAALPETGIFDTASGQGASTFIPYDTASTDGGGEECAPTETAAASIDRLHGRQATGASTRDQALEQRALRAGIAALLDEV